LKHWRQVRGLSQAALAREVLVHRDLIAKIERLRRWPSHDLVVRCESVLATGGELTRLWPEVESDRVRSRLLAAEQRLAERMRQAQRLGILVRRERQ
jgi:transcriptional regulator with XRE-family HTH domain